MFVFMADVQALTDNADDPEKIRQNIIEVALDYLAAGLDPEKCTLFIQSQIPELSELTTYLMNLVTVSRLQRNPTVKTEIKMRNFEANIPVGSSVILSARLPTLLFSKVPQCPLVKTRNRCWSRLERLCAVSIVSMMRCSWNPISCCPLIRLSIATTWN